MTVTHLERPAERADSRPDRRSDGAAGLADELVRLFRSLQAMRAQHAVDGAESAALWLLWPLAAVGPMRSGALAEHVHADASTVSRQVAELQRRGLVRREQDPADGRASLVAVTDAGHGVMGQMAERRNALLGDLLADWAPDDVATLTALLARFSDDLSAAIPTIAARTSLHPVTTDASASVTTVTTAAEGHRS